MGRKVQIVFGPPGTGKTTYLLKEVRKVFEGGVAPERIGFLSFSRRAIHEAKAHVDLQQTPHFRTIHSAAYHLLDLHRGDVVGAEHLAEFSRQIGLPFTGRDEGMWEGAAGDQCLALWGLSQARCTSLEAEWRRAQVQELPWRLVRETVGMYQAFKREHGLWDFHDMIAHAEGELPVDVLFVDEAQDTSTAQWKLLRRITSKVPVVYLAGDDDQAVYHWSGADEGQLLKFAGDRVALPQSYRLPRAVKTFADRISQGIGVRVPKAFAPRDADGRVQWVNDLDKIDLTRPGSWLLLARSNYQLTQLRQQARRQGVVYSLSNGKWSWSLPSVQAALTYERLRRGKAVPRDAALALQPYLPRPLEIPKVREVIWDTLWGQSPKTVPWFDALPLMPLQDREYVRALRRRGESLTGPGRVSIGTVHSVKGAQADHVVCLTDVSERVLQGQRIAPDAERRVQYVAATRAYQSLTLILPQTARFWAF